MLNFGLVEMRLVDKKGAAKLLSALHATQGPRRWYLAGWRTNDAGYKALSKAKDGRQPYEAYKVAKQGLKACAKARSS